MRAKELRFASNFGHHFRRTRGLVLVKRSILQFILVLFAARWGVANLDSPRRSENHEFIAPVRSAVVGTKSRKKLQTAGRVLPQPMVAFG